MMRKLFLTASLLAVLNTPLLSAQSLPPQVEEMGYADSIVVNGKVVSMDDQGYNANPGHIYQAMAIKGNKIMALGTNEQIRALAGRKTQVYDMGGKLVLPGIVDGHAHHMGTPEIAKAMGMPYPNNGRSIRVKGARDLEGTRLKVENAIKDAVKEMKPGEWLTVGLDEDRDVGATQSKLFAWTVRGDLENRQRLDPIAPNNPVLVRAGTRLTGNSMTVDILKKKFPFLIEAEKAELTDLSDPVAIGELGLGIDEALKWEIWLGDQPDTALAEMIRRDWEMMAAHGQVSFSSRTYNPRIITALNVLNRTGLAPVRFGIIQEIHRRPNNPVADEGIYGRIGSFWGLGDDMMWQQGIGTELWDSSFPLVCLSADIPGTPAEVKARELCRKPGDAYWKMMVDALGAGWRLAQFHGVGSDGLRRYTQMIEQAMKEYNIPLDEIRARRMTTDHAEAIGFVPDVMAKVKELGILISANPRRMQREPDYIRDYGPKAEEFMQPVKKWLEYGLPVVGEFESYSGIGLQFKLYIDREVFGKKVLPDQALDRVTVMKLWTTWAPQYYLKEKTMGTLEVGKYADYVVLDKDYFTIPVPEILKIIPQMTVVNGKVRAIQAGFAKTLGVEPVGYQFPPNYMPWDGTQAGM